MSVDGGKSPTCSMFKGQEDGEEPAGAAMKG
jgi:hypothetical protein